MEVMMPTSPVMEYFDFNSARSSPRSSTPSTPGRFGECFFSAPTSPTRMSEFHREFDLFSMENDRQSSKRSSSLVIPFDWEEKLGTPKSPREATLNNEEEKGDDFAFDFSEALERASLSAEELFDGGKIKPLKPPPRLQVDEFDLKSPLLSSPRSPRSPLSQGKKIIREAFSPRNKKKDLDPFATTIESSRNNTEHARGRERVQNLLSKNSSRRATRSLSPHRVSEHPWEEEEKQQQRKTTTTTTTSRQSSTLNSKPSFSSNSSKGSSRKWKLRDLLLFRSASEGRATDKDPFRKYSSGYFKKPEDNKNSSFRSTDSSGSSSAGSRRKVSAHELHYTTNKAVSENMKKKTFLPYKKGILGRLAFNPAVHALANGFGTLTRS
ncbi:hypothetical protein PTKIN_Ptkin09bG0130900 [Pterospermum kingtungense]